jgi:spore coat polysaccharide biosynthesis protein SpsF
MNVLCILQARMSSGRLPGKVLMPILGEAMLARQIERIRRARRVDRLTVATSSDASELPIAELCASLSVDCYRGSLHDVLDRFCGAARPHRPGNVLRLTGDCPLTDPDLLDALVELHLSGDYDYSSNVHERTYPDGLDAEIFRYALLEQAGREARTPFEREHVTPWLYCTGPDLRRAALKDVRDRSRLRWTVDYPEDFEFVTRVFEALYPENPAFSTEDVHRLLGAHPEIAAINAARAE